MTNFRPMKAGDLKEKDFHKLQFPLIAQPKIDGIRCVIHPELGAVSNTLKPIPNDYIREALSRPEFHGFDGELVYRPAPTNFQKTVSSVMTKKGEPDVLYIVFDYVDFENPEGVTYEDRLVLLESLFDNFSRKHPQELPVEIQLIWNGGGLPNIENVLRYEELMLSKGYEGIMLRHPDRDYKFGRSSVHPNQQHLMKLKRFSDAEAVVSDFEELMHNDNEAGVNELGLTERSTHKANKRGGGTLGKLVVVGSNGKFAGVDFQVGGGFTAAQRQEIWDNQDKYLGMTLTYKFFDVAIKDKPRHPVFKSFREGF